MDGKEFKVFKSIRDALMAAQEHLEYCNCDAWERTCAKGGKLPEQIEKALAESEPLINKNN